MVESDKIKESLIKTDLYFKTAKLSLKKGNLNKAKNLLFQAMSHALDSYKKKQDNKKELNFAHYTSIETLYFLLENYRKSEKNNKNEEEGLRLYDSYYLNDPKEGKYLLDRFFKDSNPMITIKKLFKDKKIHIVNRISNIIWRYIDIRDNNIINLGKSQFGEQVDESLLPEQFYKKYPDPFYFINEALDKVELGYQLKPVDFKSFQKHHLYKPICINNKNEEIPITRLSSGEKMLFWFALSMFDIKGIYKEKSPSLLLLDEVDAGLHPSMIKKIMEIIKKYFLPKGIKIILTTHSPTTVALAPEESLFVMKREADSTSIEKSSKKEALNTLTEGYATLETGIELISSEKDLTIITEGKNIEYITKAIEFFETNLKEKIHIITELKNKSGKDQLKIYSNFLSNLPLKNKFLFVLDCDVDISKFQKNDKVEVFKFEKQQSSVSKGIENLFHEKLFSEDFYNKKQKGDGGKVTELDKDKFRNHILEYGTKKDFINFKPLIDKIKKLL